MPLWTLQIHFQESKKPPERFDTTPKLDNRCLASLVTIHSHQVKQPRTLVVFNLNRI